MIKELYSDSTSELVGITKELDVDMQQFLTRWSRVARKCVNYANGDQTIDEAIGDAWANGQPIWNQKNTNRPEGLNVNEIEPIVRTLVSYMTRSEPTITVKTENYNDPRAKSVAKVAEDVSNALYDLDNESDVSIDEATWLLVNGTVIGKDYFDRSIGGFVDGHGRTGRNVVKILTPFQVATDWTANSFEELPYIKEDNVVRTEWIKSAYAVNEPGYTNDFDGMQEGSWGSDALTRFEQFKTAVPYLGNNGGGSRKGKVLMSEWYVPPSEKFPQGRMIVIAGGRLLYATPEGAENPYFLGTIGQEQIWHPYTFCIYEKYLGRILGKSLVEQLLPIQMRINEIYATIVKNANTVAKPNILAADRQFKKGVLNGEGSNVYTYQNQPGTQPPTIFPGAALPPQFFNELQQLTQRMVQIAGANFPTQGNIPPGVTAGNAIQILTENSNVAQAPISKRFAKYKEQRLTKKLRLLKKYQQFPDKQLNAALQAAARQEFQTSINIFIGAKDLQDNVEVKIESSSNIPKSEQQKSDSLYKLLQTGFFDKYVMDPSPKAQTVGVQVLEQLGLEPLNVQESVEVKKARWENERIMLGEAPEMAEWDNHDIHLEIVTELMQNPNFLENASNEQKELAFQHYTEHKQVIDSRSQQAEMQQKKDAADAAFLQSAEKALEKMPVQANPLFPEIQQEYAPQEPQQEPEPQQLPIQ